MRSFLLLALVASNLCFAEVGRVSKVVSPKNAHLLREGSKVDMSSDLTLNLGDEIHTKDAHLLLFLYPGTQLAVNKNSVVKISESMIDKNNNQEKAYSIVELIRGIIRLQVTRSPNQEIDQKVQADGVSFAVNGNEIEVAQEKKGVVDLNVIDGEVLVSSPFIQSFVPEVVKANESLRFSQKKKNFERRKFSIKFKNHPEFEKSETLRQKWKAKKSAKKKNK